jgi:hypothetical protein
VWAHRFAVVCCIVVLAACDPPRRVVPRSVSAPPLPPGSIEVEPVLPGAKAPRAVPDRPTLPDAVTVDAGDFELEGLSRIDLRASRESGAVTITTNDPTFDPNLGSVLDGSPNSLARSDSINPLILTFTFKEPIRLRAARIYLAGSPYDWVLEASEGDRRLNRDVPERVWSQIDLPEAVETEVVKVEALRLERDDFVHLNEVELWVESAK